MALFLLQIPADNQQKPWWIGFIKHHVHNMQELWSTVIKYLFNTPTGDTNKTNAQRAALLILTANSILDWSTNVFNKLPNSILKYHPIREMTIELLTSEHKGSLWQQQDKDPNFWLLYLSLNSTILLLAVVIVNSKIIIVMSLASGN